MPSRVLLRTYRCSLGANRAIGPARRCGGGSDLRPWPRRLREANVETMLIIVFALSWILIGAVLGIYQARRGHWHMLWVLGAMAGPFAIPLFRQVEQNEQLARAVHLSEGSGAGRSGIRVPVGVDGPDDSTRAAKHAADLFGSRLGDLTLAMVTDSLHTVSAYIAASVRSWAWSFS